MKCRIDCIVHVGQNNRLPPHPYLYKIVYILGSSIYRTAKLYRDFQIYHSTWLAWMKQESLSEFADETKIDISKKEIISKLFLAVFISVQYSNSEHVTDHANIYLQLINPHSVPHITFLPKPCCYWKTFIPEQFTVKAHPDLFDGEGSQKGGTIIQVYNSHTHSKRSNKARTLSVYSNLTI